MSTNRMPESGNYFTDSGFIKAGTLKRFAIAGKDKKFVWAKAIIKGSTITISNPKVKNPENYGIVETNGTQIIKIHEKMKKPSCNLINSGIYHFDRK